MDFQFYPTPQHLAKKLWDKFEDQPKLVLEPHAGAGDLITAYTNFFPDVQDEDEHPSLRKIKAENAEMRGVGASHRVYTRQVMWHACELNITMHPQLKALGAQVVGHDFLQMQSAAVYSHIAMNPPFRDGDSHLLHAWDIFYAGEIGCILNAETIRNPYTAQRQRLVKLIEKHGTVEFLENQFIGDGVERETSVEIALVYLRKKADLALNMDDILNGLKPDQYKADEQPDTHVLNALALPMNFVDRVVMDYDIGVEAAKQFSQADAVFQAAQQRIGFTFDEMQSKGLTAQNREPPVNFEALVRANLGEHLEKMRERAWAQVLRSTQVLDKLSSAAQRSVEAEFANISKMEFTKNNIYGFFGGLLHNIASITDEMCLGVFDMIMQRETDNCTFYRSWKSNEKHKTLAMRIKRTRFILPLMRTEFSRTYIPHNVEQVLGDIDKVFRYLDGKPTDVGYGLRESLNASGNFDAASAGERVNSEYFSVRYYPGRGTFHFFPNSVEVVERLNKHVGRLRQWLPPSMSEVNEDFVTAYEKAEKFTDDIVKAYQRSSTYRTHPAYCIANKGTDYEKERDLTKICEAIDQVHETNGIHPAGRIESKESQAQLMLCM